MTTTPAHLPPAEASTRLHEFTVLDVRTPAEYAAGHLPGALNIPLDHLRSALPEIRQAAEHGEILVVCASGTRARNACELLADEGIRTATLQGGTGAWTADGHALHHPAACDTRATWTMERQVRFTAGSLVLLGLVLAVLLHPAFALLSAGVAGGLVFSALTNTCGMAVLLGKLPHNRPRGADLDAVRTALRTRR
ncbi:rhodanese-like domain-containing protein [Streptomyces sp. NPDC006997]|uniref:rhodanese-like domain-containing protein n=1 Tax=Streptomyces sp. NPDC006997 TaxID=3155356 RepID=UPI00340C2836